MSAIDIHTHAFPDELAGRAMTKLESHSSWKSISDGRIQSLLGSMDQAGIDKSVICTIATKPDQVEGILQWCRQIRTDRIVPFPSVHPQTPDLQRWMAAFASEGFAGIKLHPMYQGFAADEPCMDPIYQAAVEHSLAVVIHCGRDIAFPMDDDGAAPVRMRSVIDRFPGLKLITTHMGGWRDWEASEQYLIGSGAYMEVSFSLTELGPDRALKMIRSHGVDKMLFGTDWPWNSQADGRAQVEQLGLTPDELHKILYANAQALIG